MVQLFGVVCGCVIFCLRCVVQGRYRNQTRRDVHCTTIVVLRRYDCRILCDLKHCVEMTGVMSNTSTKEMGHAVLKMGHAVLKKVSKKIGLCCDQ